MDAPLPGINEPETIANTITDDATGRPFYMQTTASILTSTMILLTNACSSQEILICLIIFMTVKTDVSHLKVLI